MAVLRNAPTVRVIDLKGQRFGRLTAVRFAHIDHARSAVWECVCDCGATHFAKAGQLRFGIVASCGCGRRRHGHTVGGKSSPTFKSWESMRQRCGNPNDPSFENYGGRGVTVCARWQSFKNFLDDMGERPHGTSIDRIDNDGDYEPSNCRWATHAVQQENRGNSIRYIAHGKSKTVQQWASELGISPSSIRKRIRKGMTVEQAVTTPISPARAKQKGV